MEAKPYAVLAESETPSASFDISPSVKEKNKAFMLFQKIQGAMRYIPNFGETCRAILDAVMDEMDAENCSLMLKDPVSGDLSVCAARGRSEKRSVFYSNQSGNGSRFKSGEGIAGWVLKEGQAVMVTDAGEEPRFVKMEEKLNNGVRSLICYPIRDNDQVVGVFNLSHSKRGAFSEGDKFVLSYISNQVGAALTSARFFVEMKEMSRLMRDPERAPIIEKTFRGHGGSSSTFVEVGEVIPENGIFIYVSEKMHRIKEVIDQIANTDVTVLILGESGVGKEVVARSIHLNSPRKIKPFVKVNCAALPEELLESELFGYEKGAFTGAYRQKLGKFELAEGGTIFLDEIVEMSPSLQAKLLQVLQDREFSRLGGKKDIRVDVRMLAATNKNMEEVVKSGRFREDLYYRLNVVNITVPPLRERKEEIPVFVEYFLDKFRKKYEKKPGALSDQMVRTLLDHEWQGNVRELENVIQRFVVLGNEDVIIDELELIQRRELSHHSQETSRNKKEWPSLKEVHREAMVKAESEVIRKALELTNWNRKRAAEILNISYKALLYKIKECRIDRQFASLMA